MCTEDTGRTRNSILRSCFIFHFRHFSFDQKVDHLKWKYSVSYKPAVIWSTHVYLHQHTRCTPSFSRAPLLKSFSIVFHPFHFFFFHWSDTSIPIEDQVLVFLIGASSKGRFVEKTKYALVVLRYCMNDACTLWMSSITQDWKNVAELSHQIYVNIFQNLEGWFECSTHMAVCTEDSCQAISVSCKFTGQCPRAVCINQWHVLILSTLLSRRNEANHSQLTTADPVSWILRKCATVRSWD